MAFFTGELVARTRHNQVTGTIVVEVRGDGVQQSETCDVDDGRAGNSAGQGVGRRLVAADADTGQHLAIANQRAEFRAQRLNGALYRDADRVLLSFLRRHCIEVFGQLVN